jgi:hypothetical protein
MTTVAFDTHRAAKILTTAGFTNEQVDANIEVLMEVTNNLATKDDIESLRLSTKDDIESLRLSTKDDIESLRLSTKQDTDSLHKDIEHLDQSFDLKLKALQNGLTNSLTMRFIGLVGTGIFLMKYLP